MKCEKCGTEYEGNYCPKGCNSPYVKKQKIKKPIYKKWWFWLLMGFATIITIAGIGGNLSEEDPSNTETPVIQNDTNTGAQNTNKDNIESSNTKAPAQTKGDYIASCESVAYDDIARYPDTYKGKNVYFKGKVLQVSEGTFTSKNTYRIEVTEDEYGYWDDPVLVEYKIPEGAANILEDDIVTFYGECTGTTSYKSVLGNTITIPSVAAKYIDIVQ